MNREGGPRLRLIEGGLSLRRSGSELARSLSYDALPAPYREPMRRYLTDGTEPEPPLLAVLEGKLSVAIALSRHTAIALCMAAEWVDRHLPACCHGHRDQVQLWVVYARRAHGRALLASLDGRT